MKKLYAIAATILFFVACTKPTIFSPTNLRDKATESKEYFSLSGISAHRFGDSLQLSITSSHEKDLSELVLMRGPNLQEFCKITSLEPKGTSPASHLYQFNDKVSPGDTVYYLVKFVTLTGEWGCTTPVKIFK